MQKSKNYTAVALLIPLSIALAATFLPYRNAALNEDITQPVANVGHVCDFPLCPSKGHNHYKNK